MTIHLELWKSNENHSCFAGFQKLPDVSQQQSLWRSVRNESSISKTNETLGLFYRAHLCPCTVAPVGTGHRHCLFQQEFIFHQDGCDHLPAMGLLALVGRDGWRGGAPFIAAD